MDRTPTPTVAVALIRLTREGKGITVERAAQTAGISKSRWIQIEKGYETRQGMIRPARAKVSTVARMAHAVDLSPERLETEGQDPDAAAILREIIHRRVASRSEAAGYPRAAIPALSEWLPDYVDQVWAEVVAAQAAHQIPADQLTGTQIFGEDAGDAGIWDAYRELDLKWRVRTVGLTRAVAEFKASQAEGFRAAEAG